MQGDLELPDPKICRTTLIGPLISFRDFLVGSLLICPHVRFTRKAQHCRPPEWGQFAHQTGDAP